MRDHIEGRSLVRQAFEQHPGVLFRRAAQGEVIEGEHRGRRRVSFTRSKKFDFASGPYAEAAFENVP